jgi:hypothetical protein
VITTTDPLKARLLQELEAELAGLEQNARGFGVPDTVEALVLYAVEIRQIIRRPNAPVTETRDAYARFLRQLCGQTTIPLWWILRDHGLLAEHPRLLGDFARWMLVEYPAETETR